MTSRAWPVVLVTGLTMACGGGGGEETGGERPAAGAASSAQPAAGCRGSLSGAVEGSFVCLAQASLFPGGDGPVGDPENSVFTVLVNDFDPTHTRPEGLKTLGLNVELPGEPQPGRYGEAERARHGTMAHVGYTNGSMLTELGSLSLELTEATLAEESEFAGVKARRYTVHGTAQFTVTGESDVEKASVTVTF